ncbi:MAG: hypothetical protein KGH61_02220 [Candidatus Micrarchaeota archaeon]|nr:hypothetical protein [Candidatus Micrarchaeota archaeon]MDE1847744.1 hypothetical protein [Candidatus Micrarchaeota archaeon]MDE1863887.1 hypothetical protein [Candidatus Micrarchaeota archaeon]
MAPLSKSLKIVVIAVPIVAIAAIVLGITLYTESVLAGIGTAHYQPPGGQMAFTLNVTSTGTTTFDNAKLIVPYAQAKYSVANVINLTLDLNFYARNPLPQVYLLNVTGYCYECYNQQAMYQNISATLTNYGVIQSPADLNLVGEQGIADIPRGSIVIIDSGLMPVYLLPDTGYDAIGSTVLSMLGRNDTILYIGDNFSRLVGEGGVILSEPQQTEVDLSAAGLATTLFFNKNSSSIHLHFASPTFGFAYGQYSGKITYVSSGNGTMIALANTQKSAWGNSSSEANDIGTLLSSRFWMSDKASGTVVPSRANGSVGIAAFNTTFLNAQGVGESINSSYPLLTAIITNQSDTQKLSIPLHLKFSSNGTISIQPAIGQTQIVPIAVSVGANSTTQQIITTHVDIYDKNLTYRTSINIPFFNTTRNIRTQITYSSFDIPSGSYIAILRDSLNRYYSSAIFNITNVSIVPTSLDFKNGRFLFAATSDNFALTNTTYAISLNGQYSQSGNLTGGLINYTLPRGTVIGYGNETFNIELFGTRYTYSTQNVQQVLHIPAIYIEFLIVGAVVLILNLIVKAPNRDEYYVDVPEFQQVKKVAVKVNKSEVLSVFDKVNFYYHWRYMPLTIEEIKSGVGTNIRYNNIPVSITLQNALAIVSRLVVDGDVVGSGNYYAPKRWVEESGYDIEYLSIFRRVRDYCVGHSILFTDIGTSEKADITLSKSGVQVHALLYSGISGIRDIGISQESRTYIIFADQEKKLQFTERLYGSYGNQSEMLKMGLSYEYIRLIDASELDQLIF